MDLVIKTILQLMQAIQELVELILGLLVGSKKVKLIGDKSLSSRDFSRVILPLKNLVLNFIL